MPCTAVFEMSGSWDVMYRCFSASSVGCKVLTAQFEHSVENLFKSIDLVVLNDKPRVLLTSFILCFI